MRAIRQQLGSNAPNYNYHSLSLKGAVEFLGRRDGFGDSLVSCRAGRPSAASGGVWDRVETLWGLCAKGVDCPH